MMMLSPIVAPQRKLVAILFLFLLVGCGSSTSDPMARAKMRRRPDASNAQPTPSPSADGGADAEQAAEPPARGEMPAVGVASSNESANPMTTEPLADAATTSSSEGNGEPTGLEKVTIAPISQRRPEQPLSEDERRERSAENIKKIGAAVIAYSIQTGMFPPSAPIESEGGIKTLSWRVAILPFLGYQDLYDQFDPNEPWDGDNNSKLLELIPDEFVSPERFDTKTNYLGPAFRSFMFGVDRIGPSGIEDGAANTILLVEVDDEFAVEWTRPADYDAPALNMKRGLGHLRGDGAIALWANGMPTLLPNDASEQQLLNAFTHDASDGQQAGMLHRPISIEVEAATAFASNDTAEAMSDIPGALQPPEEPDDASEPQVARIAVPKAADLAEAANKLRTVFIKRLEDTKSDADRAAIASEMIPQAVAMAEDPAGAYSLLSAATTLATNAADFNTAVEAVETKIRTFEVEAYEENAALLVAFGKANSGRRGDKSGADEYVQRAIRVVHAGIRLDDFSRTSTIARYALAFKGDNDRDETVIMLNRLRTQLGVARGHYTRTGLALATLRDNPHDKQAAEEVGRFLCFVKGDWDTGLELLAKAENPQLSELAAADMAGSDAATDMLALADRWWDLSDSTTQGLFRQACRDRAVMWYEAANAQLPESLDKLHAKARLDEAGEIKATSPLALVRRLADESNVDL